MNTPKNLILCKNLKAKNIIYLPSFVSSSNSDGMRFVRRHNVAIIPIWSVKQHIKSMINDINKIPPTATAMIDADEKIRFSLKTIGSLPKII